MEKLELKHLAPYLPYKVGIEIFNYKRDYVGVRYSTINGFYMIKDEVHVNYVGGSTGKSFTEFKPILRPLSDIDDDLFEEIGFADEEDFKESVENGDILYNNQIKLISMHFDVFGLIDAGLAIDINTI